MSSVYEHIATNTKAAASVAAATIGSGLGLVLSLVPEDVGKLATLVGILLSAALIRRARAEARKFELEIEIMRAQERDRVAALERRARTPRDDLSAFGRVAGLGEVRPDSKPLQSSE